MQLTGLAQSGRSYRANLMIHIRVPEAIQCVCVQIVARANIRKSLIMMNDPSLIGLPGRSSLTVAQGGLWSGRALLRRRYSVLVVIYGVMRQHQRPLQGSLYV